MDRRGLVCGHPLVGAEGLTMSRPLPREREPRLSEVAPHVERRMEGQTGRVTLHYVEGTLRRVEYTTFEDARALPRSA